MHLEPESWIEIPELIPLASAMAGDGRFRYLYANPNTRKELIGRARELVSDRAWVWSRSEVLEMGLFGEGATGTVPGRIGSVVLAAREPVAFVDPALPNERSLQVGSREPHPRRDVRAAARDARRGLTRLLGAQHFDLERDARGIRVPALRCVLDQAHERGLAEKWRLDPRNVELAKAVAHVVAGDELADRDLLPLHMPSDSRLASRETRSAHSTSGICNGRRAYAAACSRAGRPRQSTAIWMFAGNTPTNTAAAASPPIRRVEDRATATAQASSATPLT